MFRQPARSLVVRVEPGLPLSLGAFLGSAMRQPVLQTLTSSFSLSASAMTFWATWVGTSS
jgi:hypothetical protein